MVCLLKSLEPTIGVQGVMHNPSTFLYIRKTALTEEEEGGL